MTGRSGRPDVQLEPSGVGSPGLRLSAVVPCYNEGGCLNELYRRLSSACVKSAGDNFEIVLVNDGSTDNTWDLISEFADEDSHVVGVNLSRNHGHQLALTAGLSLCQGERIFIIDADLQDPPELLDAMMKMMDEGVDVVYGQRASRQGETWFKRYTAGAFYRLLQSLTDMEIPIDTGDFRLMSRRVLEVLLQMPEQHRFIRGMVSWAGFEQVPLRYDRAERFAGQTKYPSRKMVTFAIDAITSFSSRPLRIASYLGGIFALLGIILLVYTMYGWLFLDTVRGWTSLMTVVLLLGGAQMFILGVFGEYIGRLYVEAKRRPLFVIKEIARSGDHRSKTEGRRPHVSDQQSEDVSGRT